MKRIDIDTDRLRASCWVSGPETGTPVLLRIRPRRSAAGENPRVPAKLPLPRVSPLTNPIGVTVNDGAVPYTVPTLSALIVKARGLTDNCAVDPATNV